MKQVIYSNGYEIDVPDTFEKYREHLVNRYSGYKEVEKEDESSNSGSIYMPSTTPEKVVVYQMTVICSLGGGINE